MNEAQALLPHRTTIGATDYSLFGYVGWAGKVQPSQVAEGRTKGGAALGTSANIVSSVSAERALGNYAMKLWLTGGKTKASVGQQYFMRVWDAQPKTVALKIYSEADIAIRACLELRGNGVSTAAARQNPIVRCFKPVELTAGSWQPVQFEFTPPARSDYRGLRIRFDVLPHSDAGHAVYLDDLKFISWGKSGLAVAADTVSLSDDRRWNVLGITCVQVAKECGQLTTSRY